MKERSELVRKYLFDVVRRLPEKQRKDIEEELETLIEDMLEERAENGRSEEENVKDILKELGAPAALTAKYRGDRQYLLGGEYYPLYCQVLKIVLICVAAGMVIAAVVSSFVQAATGSVDVDGMIAIVTDGAINIGAIPSALLQAFGMVTLIFVLFERNQVKLQEKSDWSVDYLPDIPEKKAVLSRVDSIVGIVFTVLVTIMFVYVPELMGAWLKTESGSMVAVPLFDLEVWNKVLPLLLLGMAVGFVNEGIKLVKGRYCPAVLWSCVVDTAVNIFVTVEVLLFSDVWNKSFTDEIAAITGQTIPDLLEGGLVFPAANAVEIFVGFIVLACLLELGVTTYHTLRYGLKK